MALSVGARLGHCDVTALIGEGGMAHVYRATDTKLNRQVALKILPEASASDPDRRTRRSRMARNRLSLRSVGVVTAAVLAVPLVALHAGQPPGVAVPMDTDDIAGVVTGPIGPEAGVWRTSGVRDRPRRVSWRCGRRVSVS